MLATLLAATLVSTLPPEPDLAYITLHRNGVWVDDRFADQAQACIVFTVSTSAGTYTTTATDTSGNESAPSNPIRINPSLAGDLDFDGDVDIADSVRLRRDLAGLP